MNHRNWKDRHTLLGVILFFGAPFARLSSAQSATQQTDDATKKVDAVFADVAKAGSPGCAVGVIRDGKLIYGQGYGQAVVEHGVPITTKTVFDLGSVSKHFTATAIVLLAQQGKLSLDDEVRKYVPELPDYSKAGSRGQGAGGRGNLAGSKAEPAATKAQGPLTIRHLLHHTGGVRNYDTLMALAGVDFSGRTGDKEALDYIVRQKELNFAPGEEYLYSNSGYFLLSLVVKKASGKTLREFAAENIFAPLGMKDSQYLDDTTLIIPRRATAYEPKRSGGGFAVDMSNFEQTGDGAVQTTIEDFLLWDQNFTSGQVLGAQGLEWLQTPGTLNNGSKITYAFGLQVSKYKGLPTVEHGGAWAGYRAHYARFPEQKFSVVCLCNVGNANPTRRAHQVAEIYLASLMKNPPAARPGELRLTAPGSGVDSSQAAYAATPEERAAWKNYAGLYRNAKTGGLRRVIADGEKLRLRVQGQSYELEAMNPTQFRIAPPGPPVVFRFEAAEAGKYRLIQPESDGGPTLFEAKEVFTPTPAQQRAFLGTFYSDEADVTYTLYEKEGKLQLRIGKWTEMPIEPAFRDAFSYRMGQLLFERNAQGRVTGFQVQAGQVRNIRFLRAK